VRRRTWDAYASNNSGSYTIVGLLPSEEVADEVAEAIRVVAAAHTAWLEADGAHADSPLVAFCREHGLSAPEDDYDAWPRHSGDNRPSVAVVGRQVIVHHEYTATLTPTFGELFYRRGGRVQHEEDHAHHAIAVVAALYWGWSREERAREATELPHLIAALTAPDGPLAVGVSAELPPAWRTSDGGFGDAPLTIGVVFDDLIAGVERLRKVADDHGARLSVRLHELASESHDPFGHLRPSTPAAPRFDVELHAAGPNPEAVIVAMFDTFGLFRTAAAKRLAGAPCTLGRALVEGRAEAAVAALARAGADVRMVRNDA
jgi:hypothetical protein